MANAGEMQILQQLLLSTIDARPDIRIAAEKQLKAASSRDLCAFLSSLSHFLLSGHTLNPPTDDVFIAQQIAALTFKNAISAKDATLDDEAVEKWREIPAPVAAIIKGQVLQAISCDNAVVAKAVCQVLSKLGRIELYAGRFEELLPAMQTLVQTASAAEATESDKAKGCAALTCLAFLCEELSDVMNDRELDTIDVLKSEHCNIILTTVVHGLRDVNAMMKVSALRALYHVLMFAKDNFDRKEERDFLLSTVVEAARSQSQQVQVAAFECLVQIATGYYSYLEPYMNTIGQLTWTALECDSDNICLAAMEVWNTIAEEELCIMEDEGSMVPTQNLNIIKQGAPFLLPLLLKLMTKQMDEDLEDDAWTPNMAAGTCLGFCAQVLKDDILPIVLEFVRIHFNSANWNEREAAMMSFGSVMEGPNSDALKMYVADAFKQIVKCLSTDTSIAVRDSAAWTLGRIAQHHTPVILPFLLLPEPTQQPAEPLLITIVNCLADQPRVAVHICWTIHELAGNINTPESQEAAKAATTAAGTCMDFTTLGDSGRPLNSALDGIFTQLCDALVRVSERPDADEKNLRGAAFNCIGALINSAGENCTTAMFALLEHFVSQLTQSFHIEQNEHIKQRQGMLCGVIQILCLRLGPRVEPAAAQLWTCLSNVLRVPGVNDYSFAHSSSTDALLAISSLINAIGPDITKFSSDIFMLINEGIRTSFGNMLHENPTDIEKTINEISDSDQCDLSTARICMELVGDMARSVNQKTFSQYAIIIDQINALLQNPLVDRSLKPILMITIGDIALNYGIEFSPWLDTFIPVLNQAGRTGHDQGPPNWRVNDDWLWYIHDLRDAVLQALISIVCAMREGSHTVPLKAHVNGILCVIKAIAESPISSHGVAKNIQQCIELVGDLVSLYGKELAVHLKSGPFLVLLFQKAQICCDENPELVEKVRWLENIVARYSQNP